MNGYTLGHLRGQSKWQTDVPIWLPLEFYSFAKRLFYENPRYKSSDCSAEAIRKSSWPIRYCLKKSNWVHTHTHTHTHINNLVQLRGGTAALEVETGRWRGVGREGRVCRNCRSEEVENVEHWLLRCAGMAEEREKLIMTMREKMEWQSMEDDERVKLCM